MKWNLMASCSHCRVALGHHVVKFDLLMMGYYYMADMISDWVGSSPE